MTDTIKLRIAVVIDDAGYWFALGECGLADNLAMKDASGGIDDFAEHCWINVEIPRPASGEIACVVKVAE